MKMAMLLLVTLVAMSVQAAEQIEVFFSPRGGCTDAIVREIGQAKKNLRLQAYSFTSAPIAKAILEAKKRGVDVQAILDKSNDKDRYSVANLLINAGVPVYIDGKVKIAHSKVIILDERTVITGSFNFTKSAEEDNAENLLIIHDPKVAEEYSQQWDIRKNVSTRR